MGFPTIRCGESIVFKQDDDVTGLHDFQVIERTILVPGDAAMATEDEIAIKCAQCYGGLVRGAVIHDDQMVIRLRVSAHGRHRLFHAFRAVIGRDADTQFYRNDPAPFLSVHAVRSPARFVPVRRAEIRFVASENEGVRFRLDDDRQRRHRSI